ncbi:Imm26 family immunity protein [Kribbella sp. NPDC055071]
MAVGRRIGEGEYFGVPLSGGAYGLGVAARIGQDGTILGYFSSVRYESLPSVAEIDFTMESAVWIKLFGDLGLLEGRWPIIGSVKDWDPRAWPLPDFVRHEELSGRSYRVSYAGDLRNRPEQMLSDPERLAGLPDHGLAGDKFVELKLERLLGSESGL